MECIVCFTHYDEEEHQPRSIPCDHTLCSKCLKRDIREGRKICPKCRKNFSASNVTELPCNFSLEDTIKLMNSFEKPPECNEHHLPISHRCTSHKSWICQNCLSEDHSTASDSCNVITMSEDLSNRKTKQLNQSKPLVDAFEEKYKYTDECKKQCKKQKEEQDKKIAGYEAMMKRLQEEIQKQKTSKLIMENDYAVLDQKMETLKRKRSSYDKAVKSLKSSETIKGVSTSSVKVEYEAKKLQSISRDLENETNWIGQVFNITAESSNGNFKLSEKDEEHHINIFQWKISSKSPLQLKFTDESDLPLTDGILTFLDIGWPNEKPRRVYIKMLGNSARARQHLLLVTGQCGHSYKGLKFYSCDKQGMPGENIAIHPYDGKNAAPLLKDVTITDIVKHEVTAGLVTGASFKLKGTKDSNNAYFSVRLRDWPTATDPTGFGRVISGLEILQELAKSDKIKEIKVVDCGIEMI